MPADTFMFWHSRFQPLFLWTIIVALTRLLCIRVGSAHASSQGMCSSWGRGTALPSWSPSDNQTVFLWQSFLYCLLSELRTNGCTDEPILHCWALQLVLYLTCPYDNTTSSCHERYLHIAAKSRISDYRWVIKTQSISLNEKLLNSQHHQGPGHSDFFSDILSVWVDTSSHVYRMAAAAPSIIPRQEHPT